MRGRGLSTEKVFKAAQVVREGEQQRPQQTYYILYMKWLIEIFYNLSIQRAEGSTKNVLKVHESEEEWERKKEREIGRERGKPTTIVPLTELDTCTMT